MDINVNIDADSINAALTQAILESALGKELNKIINEEVDKISRSRPGSPSPLEEAVSKQISYIVLKVMQEEYIEQIKSAVREKISSEFTDQIIDKLWKVYIDKFF